MPTIRKILRVFLASPGDLDQERDVVRKAGMDFNASWADELGYQVEIFGWENAVAKFGRPQDVLNQDLDRCDLFIGMIWKKWGTPPDNDDRFTSGFHEEFERSLSRREQNGSPEIALFFKQISDDLRENPDDDLKKVLRFREDVIQEKKIFFQEFKTDENIKELAGRCISDFVSSIKAQDQSSVPNEAKVKRTEPNSETAQNKKVNLTNSPLSAEGLEFLMTLTERFGEKGAMRDISSSDVARFRLLANTISKPDNQEFDLGVQDANILFSAYFNGMKIGRREIFHLIRLGFRYLNNENVPLWCWYAAQPISQFDIAFYSAAEGINEEEKIGAIRVLDSLSRDLPSEDGIITKQYLIDFWFSDASSTRVISAALDYLAKKGTMEEYSIAKKEHDKSRDDTYLPALNCMIRILLRAGQEKSAQQLALKSQFESLNSDTLHEVLNGLDNLETEALIPGLGHRNAQIRLRTIQVLHDRDALDHNMIEKLLEDSDASVRNEAVMILINLKKSFTEDEIRKILVQPKKQPIYSIFGVDTTSSPDRNGEQLFAQYRLGQLKNLSEAELTRQVQISTIFDDEYFARAEKYFSKYAEELRRNIDDTFRAYYEERIQRINTFVSDFPSGEVILQSSKDMEDVSRKMLTRRGLDILCAKGNAEDLMRIRSTLKGGYAGTSIADAKYMRKRGQWTDILLLANADTPSASYVLGLADYFDFQDEVAKAILNMGRSRSISSFFSLEIPSAILKRTMEYCAVLRFSEISHDVLLRLFDHEAADVRKAASLMAVRALSAKQIKSLLSEYISSDTNHYYNVIHWLDLGVSMSRDEARRVALAASG